MLQLTMEQYFFVEGELNIYAKLKIIQKNRPETCQYLNIRDIWIQSNFMIVDFEKIRNCYSLEAYLEPYQTPMMVLYTKIANR